MRDPGALFHKGVATVAFMDPKACDEAVKQADGAEIMGQALRVTSWKARNAHAATVLDKDDVAEGGRSAVLRVNRVAVGGPRVSMTFIASGHVKNAPRAVYITDIPSLVKAWDKADGQGSEKGSDGKRGVTIVKGSLLEPSLLSRDDLWDMLAVYGDVKNVDYPLQSITSNPITLEQSARVTFEDHASWLKCASDIGAEVGDFVAIPMFRGTANECTLRVYTYEANEVSPEHYEAIEQEWLYLYERQFGQVPDAVRASVMACRDRVLANMVVPQASDAGAPPPSSSSSSSSSYAPGAAPPPVVGQGGPPAPVAGAPAPPPLPHMQCVSGVCPVAVTNDMLSDVPTHVLCCRNAFLPSDEVAFEIKEGGQSIGAWKIDLLDDLVGGLSNGGSRRVVRATLNDVSDQGMVYIEFADVHDAIGARQEKQGITYNERALGIDFVKMDAYTTHIVPTITVAGAPGIA